MRSVKMGVLLSGGVDSSVALLTLKKTCPEADVTAYYLKIWLEDELAFMGTCPWESDLAFAREVCDAAGVSLKVLSLQREYWDEVVSYTVAELEAGRTPSPDIICNRRIKFGAFLDRVGESLDKVISGHYAVVREDDDGFFRLLRSPDPVKDQTYFLSHLRQDQLAKAHFPIGGLRKSDVRKTAEEWNLPNKNRKDSQGICFLGNIKYTDFVKHYLGEAPGSIVEAGTGRVLGAHRGSWFYTMGQRSGLGLSGGPWFVVAKDKDANTVTVAQMSEASALAPSRLRVVKPHWIAEKPLLPNRFQVKLRHGPGTVGAWLRNLPGDDGEPLLELALDEADRGAAPGQFAVFYQEDVCMGGATLAGSISR